MVAEAEARRVGAEDEAETSDLEETTRLEETTKPDETVHAEHEVEGDAILTPRAFDGLAVLPEDITKEAVMPLTSSELLPLVVEPNQDNAQKILFKEIPQDLDKEAVKVLEETPKVREKKTPNALRATQ